MLAVVLMTSLAWAVDPNLENSIPAPKAGCIGRASDPVAAIYLHGLFKAQGAMKDSGDFEWRKLEYDNREKLKKFAEENHIRIALPLAPKISAGGYQRWESGSDNIPNIMEAAKAACGVKELAKDRPHCIMGFSRGGNFLKDMADKSCAQFGENTKAISFGIEKPWPARGCDGNFRILDSGDDKFAESCGLSQVCGFTPPSRCSQAVPSTVHSSK